MLKSQISLTYKNRFFDYKKSRVSSIDIADNERYITSFSMNFALHIIKKKQQEFDKIEQNKIN